MTHKILFILLQTKDEYPKKYTVTTRAWALGLSDVWVVGWAYTQGGGYKWDQNVVRDFYVHVQKS